MTPLVDTCTHGRFAAVCASQVAYIVPDLNERSSAIVHGPTSRRIPSSFNSIMKVTSTASKHTRTSGPQKPIHSSTHPRLARAVSSAQHHHSEEQQPSRSVPLNVELNKHHLSKRHALGLAAAAVATAVAAPLTAAPPAAAAKAGAGDWSSPGLAAPEDEAAPKFYKTAGGVKVQELTVGSGPAAQMGDTVLFDYVSSAVRGDARTRRMERGEGLFSNERVAAGLCIRTRGRAHCRR